MEQVASVVPPPISAPPMLLKITTLCGCFPLFILRGKVVAFGPRRHVRAAVTKCAASVCIYRNLIAILLVKLLKIVEFVAVRIRIKMKKITRH